MLNLEKISGLPLSVGDDYKLSFGDKLQGSEPAVRKLLDLAPVLMDKNAKSDRDEMYYVYRDVHFPWDEEVLRNNSIRYDLTVIPPAMIGKEYVKTLGHYHSKIPNSEIAYPEIYEVLHGEALFLIQKLNTDGTVNTVLAIEAKTGDKVIYPPNYGHIIINTGKDVLVTANFVSDRYQADYRSVSEKQGMAYYVVKGKNTKFEFIPNPAYGDVPQVRAMVASKNPGARIVPEGPMYKIGVLSPARLEFLNHPARYAVELSAISS